jgi:hypothetical protein
MTLAVWSGREIENFPSCFITFHRPSCEFRVQIHTACRCQECGFSEEAYLQRKPLEKCVCVCLCVCSSIWGEQIFHPLAASVVVTKKLQNLWLCILF